VTKQPHIISRTEARRLAIAHQGLHASQPFGNSRRGVYRAISHLGYIQIDTISVAARAHNHVLWSRVPNYTTKHLLDLQVKDRSVLEFWAHAAAYVPMQDYRFLIPTMEHFRNHHDPWPKSDRKTMQWVLDRIRNEGPLKSRDFEAPPKGNTQGWWAWKPAKLALQRLFFCGDIMVSHREGFQRVFDLAERVIPAGILTTPPANDEFARHLIFNTIRAHGVARVQEMYYLRRGIGELVRKELATLVDAGHVFEVRVRGVDDAFYSTPGTLNKPVRIARAVKLLSPFDNAVIQRDRLSEIFGFDYQIECYVPKPKRKFGYYCLPVLYGDQFFGRVDVKADRKTHELQLLHLYFEDKKLPADIVEKFAHACSAFAEFNTCKTVKLGEVNPPQLKREIEKQLSDLFLI